MTDDAPASRPPSPAQQMLASVEDQFATLGKTFDVAGLTLLRAMVAGHAELGGAIGRVTGSLYQLLDQLLETGRFDREALAVHLSAWRLLLTSEPTGEEVEALFVGLKAIRDLYAEPKAA
ncbi:MAG: hypothetical protein JF588_09620 [Caulobacterales bacterium]|nr:hypothetical protein [Caulobacterales bacterium]